MADKFDDGIEKPAVRGFEDGMAEAAGMFLRDLWRYELKPKLFSRQESHTAAQKAGTDALARLAKDDPLTDEAYA